MFSVLLTDSFREKIDQKLEGRNLGNRTSGFNGSKQQQRIGVYGEIAVKRLLGMDETISDGFDEGIDLTVGSYSFDVKTTRRTVPAQPNYEGSVKKTQVYGEVYKNNSYIFCSYNINNNHLTIIGAIQKDTFKSNGWLVKYGESIGCGQGYCKSDMVTIPYNNVGIRDFKDDADMVEFFNRLEGIESKIREL